jgi:hypothetical protein
MCLVFLMLLSSLHMTVSGDENGLKINEVNFLKALGILDENASIDPSENITRGEFAVYISKLLGIYGTGDRFPQKFSDIDDSVKDASEINRLADMGIVTGYADGAFYYDSYIKVGEALKMIVTALGYNQEAEQKGGYPAGYAAKASVLGFRLSKPNNDDLNYGSLAGMLFNALHVDIRQNSGYGADERYVTVKGQTLLTNIFKIINLKNVKVTATYITGLSGKSYLNEGTVEISYVKYETGKTDAEKYLGYSVNIYYKEDEGVKTLIYVAPKENYSIFEIDVDDIVSYRGGTLTYDKNDRQANLKIPKEIDIIYNGAASNFEDFMFGSGDGRIKFLDSDGDSQYDILFIDRCDNLLVSIIDYEDRKIYDKYSLSKFVDAGSPTDIIYHVLTVSGGYEEKLEFEDISEGDFLSVFQSRDGNYIKIYVNNGAVHGTITEISDEYYVIDDVSYKISKASLAAVPDELTAGTAGTFLFDIYGKLAGYTVEYGSYMKYAYLVGVNTKTGLGDTVQVKMFDQSGEMKILGINAKAELNGRSLTLSRDGDLTYLLDTFKTDPQSITVQNGYVWQIFRYALNSDGKINKLETINFMPENKPDELSVYHKRASTIYKSGIRSFDLRFNISDSTVIFSVPQNPAAADDRHYRILRPNYFSNDSSYTVEAYNANDAGTVGAMVFFSDEKDTASVESPLLIVDKVTATMNNEGILSEKLYGIANGRYISVVASDDSKLTVEGRKLQRGDIIRYTVNIDEELSSVVLDYDITKKYTRQDINSRGNVFWGFNGIIYSIENGYVLAVNDVNQDISQINFDKSSAMLNFLSRGTGGSRVYIYIYDEKTDTVSIGTPEDLRDYKTTGGNASRILARFRYETCKEIIIFK